MNSIGTEIFGLTCGSYFSFFFSFFLFLFFFFFLWLHLGHMEVPRLGVKSELQMPTPQPYQINVSYSLKVKHQTYYC
ncbi:hypothetical protein EI007_25860 [Escherichia coli]|nr:hypothetical protein [Escherichia coli]